MALNFDNFETVLQTKLDTITDEKDMLLLGKAIEATVGNVTVSEVQAEGTTQKNAVTAEGGTQISAVQAQGTSERSQINAMSSGFATTSSLSPVATSGSATDLSNLRTVGGQSIAGAGGDIATLPSQTGASGKVLKSDGTSASWGSSFDELSDVGFVFDTCGGEGPAGPSANYVSERYLNITGLNSSNLNVRQTAAGNQVITIQEAGTYLIMCAGASGGGTGGQGGVAWGQIALNASDVLYMRVGQKGLHAQPTTTTTAAAADSTNLTNSPSVTDPIPGGGFGDGKGGNGGGTSSGWTSSGGGGTSVRLNSDTVGSRIIVAGGGGGSYSEGSRGANTTTGVGGDGGGFYGLYGESNNGTPPQGGSQNGGGAVGNGGGNVGTQAQGGNGPSNDGGGGGGGHWGGGSGVNMGGAGGSGYIGGMLSTARGFQSGGNAGNGWILIRKVL